MADELFAAGGGVIRRKTIQCLKEGLSEAHIGTHKKSFGHSFVIRNQTIRKRHKWLVFL